MAAVQLLVLTITWEGVKDRAPGVLLIIGVLLLAFVVFQAVFPRVTRAAITRGARLADEETARRADTIVSVVQRTTGIVLLVIAIIMVLQAVQVNVTAIVTGLGITGLALALGAQTLVRDAINGIFLLAEDQYRRGDVVRIADVMGTVEEITLRRTIVRDVDGVVHSVPNGSIGVVSNYTRDFAQVNVPVRIAYGEELTRVKDAVARVAEEMQADGHFGQLLIEGPTAGPVESVGDQGISVTVTARARPSARWEVEGELRRRLLEVFVSRGIRVPFGQVQAAGEGAAPEQGRGSKPNVAG